MRQRYGVISGAFITYVVRTSSAQTYELDAIIRRLRELGLFYRRPTKLREGHVFTRVCLSVSLFTGWGAHVTITHDTLDLNILSLLMDTLMGKMGCAFNTRTKQTKFADSVT